jgi:hypothetical protein
MTCGVAAPASEEFHIPPNILKVGASSGLATYEGGTALTTDPIEAEALTKVLRDLLAKNLPDPVTKSNHNWGQQKAVTTNVRHRDGMKPWTEQVEEMRNDGTWRRSEVRLPDRDKIALAVTELSHPEEGKMLVTVGVVAERVELMFEQQIWRKGLRLYSGETRGHCKGGLVLKAEITTKAEPKPGSLLPNIVLKVHVISAELYYDKLVVDHTAGLGGEAAKALGEFTIGIIKAVKPHLEKDLLEKAQASIVKAAQKNELTLTLDKLMAAKPKAIPKKP